MDAYTELAARSRATPQSEAADPRQVRNNAGGFTFALDPLAQARRFLILGSDAPTFYQQARELTAENAKVITSLVGDPELGVKLVEMIVDVSTRALAPRTQPALFALALASTRGAPEVRAAANAALLAVARTGTHLLTFVKYADALGGWGRGRRRAVSSWYLDKTVDDLAYQVAKYRQRDGCSHRDVLRLAHPKTAESERRAVFDWITGHEVGAAPLPRILDDFAQAQKEPGSVLALLKGGSPLSWEMLPDEALADRRVWDALLDNRSLPATALMRQLPRLTRLGVIGPLGAGRTAEIAALLQNETRLKKGRIHPLQVLIAHKTYANGVGRGGRDWTPVTAIVDALDAAFYKAFESAEPAGKRTLIGLDVSGSMDAHTDPSGILTAREVGAAMALVTTATEPGSEVYGFTSKSGRGYGFGSDSAFTPLNISPRQRLNDVISSVSHLPFGATDCSMPMREAEKNGWEVDTFVVITDNETWAGPEHPHQALKNYRRATGIPAKLVVLSVTATPFSIADPSDAGMLDVVGFGSDVPTLVTDFSRGW